MKDHRPLFSVIIPTHNRANLFCSSIESMLNKKCSDFELIIVDDGSTDNTREVVNSYEEMRSRYYYQLHGERRNTIFYK